MWLTSQHGSEWVRTGGMSLSDQWWPTSGPRAQITRLMRPTMGPPGANRTQVGLMLAPLILLSGYDHHQITELDVICTHIIGLTLCLWTNYAAVLMKHCAFYRVYIYNTKSKNTLHHAELTSQVSFDFLWIVISSHKRTITPAILHNCVIIYEFLSM